MTLIETKNQRFLKFDFDVTINIYWILSLALSILGGV
jgi:hypothetical protein